MKQLPNKALLRPDEVAKHYRVSRSVVYSWISTGRLEAVKIAGHLLRIPREALSSIETPAID